MDAPSRPDRRSPADVTEEIEARLADLADLAARHGQLRLAASIRIAALEAARCAPRAA